MAAVLTFLSGCVFFPTCFTFFKSLLRRVHGARLSEADVVNISVKCVSSLQALTSTCVGYVIVTSCPDIMTDSHWLSNAYAWFALPYFYYDTWAMYQSHQQFHPYLINKPAQTSVRHFLSRNTVMMVHHVFMPLVFFPIILFFRKGQGDYFVGVFYMIEIAIPFLAVWGILVQLKLTERIYAKIVGLMMIVVFIISRILVFPFLFWAYSNYKNISFWNVVGSIPIKCNVGCLILLLPQLYWLGLMIRGAYRVLYKKISMREVSASALGKVHDKSS